MICQVCDTKSTTLCSSSISRDVICIPGTARYVIPKQPHDVFHSETERPRVKKRRRWYISLIKVVGMIDHVWHALKIIPGTARYVIRNQPHDVHDRSHMMWYVYHELLGMYVVRNQAETAENAESTSKHQRIQQYAIFHFMFWRRNDIYTMNCQVCDTNWSISSRRCQKHERTCAFTAVRDFPV